MEITTLIIPIVISLLLAVLCLSLITSRLHLILKVILILSVSGVCFLVWDAMDSYRGWAAVEKPPKEFLLIWAEIREPRQAIGDKGAIYIWIRSLPSTETTDSIRFLKYLPTSGEPRTHRLPYSRQLHEAAAKALEQIAKGGMVMGTRGTLQGQQGDGDQEGTGAPMLSAAREGRANDGGSSQGQGVSIPDTYVFHVLPPGKLLGK